MVESRRQQQADARRAQLLDIALDLFAQQGFDATSTQQIASAAGVTQGLVFHYFGSKEGLLTAVLTSRHSFATKMADLLAEADASNMPIKDVLQALCSGWLATLRQETNTSLLLAGLALTNHAFGANLTDTISGAQKRLTTLFERRRESGEIRPGVNLAVATHDILTPVIVFFLLHHTSPTWDVEASQFVEDHCELWAQMLQP